MKLIAHRVFEDHRPIEAFDWACLKGFDGAEFDLRCGVDGETYVFHAPFLKPRKTQQAVPERSLSDACRVLGEAPAALEVLLMDIKTLGAAQHAAAFVAKGGLAQSGLDRTRPMFLAWHSEEATHLLSTAPEAPVFYVIAPITARRLLRIAPEDLFATNHFPYLASARKFRPRRGTYNSHNINVRFLKRVRRTRLAPEGVAGVCLQKRFFSPALVEAARADDLKIAVFGWKSISEAKAHPLAEALDFAIVSGPKTEQEAVARRRAEAKKRLAARRRRRLLGADGAG